MQNLQSDYQTVYDKAIKLLSMRQHTKFELSKKLSARKYSAELIQQVLNELSEQRLLNDRQFAEVFLDNMIRYKTFGYYMLRAKLQQRGIDTQTATELLEENFSNEQELAVAQKFLNRNKNKDKIKLAQALSRKGFRAPIISNVLKETS